jgi:hypothetical protein
MDGAPSRTDRQVIRSAHFPFDFAFVAELLRLPDGQCLIKNTDDLLEIGQASAEARRTSRGTPVQFY